MCRYGAAFHGATHARRDTFHCLLHSSRPFLFSSVFLARSPANNRPCFELRRAASTTYRALYISSSLFTLSSTSLCHLSLFLVSLRRFTSSTFSAGFNLPTLFSLHSSLLPLLFVFFPVQTSSHFFSPRRKQEDALRGSFSRSHRLFGRRFFFTLHRFRYIDPSCFPFAPPLVWR